MYNFKSFFWVILPIPSILFLYCNWNFMAFPVCQIKKIIRLPFSSIPAGHKWMKDLLRKRLACRELMLLKFCDFELALIYFINHSLIEEKGNEKRKPLHSIYWGNFRPWFWLRVSLGLGWGALWSQVIEIFLNFEEIMHLILRMHQK